MSHTKEESIKHLADLVGGTHIAMLTTMGVNGHFHSRPMATMENREFNGELWFFTAKSSPKVQEILAEPRVNVAFSDPEKQNYVSLAGRATHIIDRGLNEKYWNPAVAAWFKDGIDDPELSLLKIEVESAEYWDSPHTFVAHVIGFAKSKLGQEPQAGENEKIEFS